ncbi:MAG: MarR family winged helix-turn-helix transcriptional regulator [Sphingomonadaceae bacterium]
MSDQIDPALLIRFSRLIAADGYDRGLQPVQWQALSFLHIANRFSRTPKALTAWLGQTKGSVSQTIAALEKKGLLRKNADKADLRVTRLELTAKGRSLLQEPPPDLAEQMLAHLAAPQREQLYRLIRTMLTAQLAVNGGRPFGLCRDCRHFRKSQSAGMQCGLLNVALSKAESEKICIEQEAA